MERQVLVIKKETENKLTEDQKLALEQEITLQELACAVSQMPNDKTPGLDGLLIEIYKMFWNKLGETYHRGILAAKKRRQTRYRCKKGSYNANPKRRQRHSDGS